MALIKCEECGREISDKAAACVGCGAPIVRAAIPGPTRIYYDQGCDAFIGTKALAVKLAVNAIRKIGWRLDSADENTGIVAFTTGVTWASWRGVSGTIAIEDVAENKFRAVGSSQQDETKADKVMETMRVLAS